MHQVTMITVSKAMVHMCDCRCMHWVTMITVGKAMVHMYDCRYMHWVTMITVSKAMVHLYDRFSLSHILISQNWSTFLPPFSYFIPFTSFYSVFYSYHPYYHSAPVLWNNLTSDLRHVAHHVTPFLLSNSPVSDLSTSLFLKKLKTYLFHSSFPP